MPPAESAAYLKAVESALRLGNATEHTHRAALERFIEDLFPGTDAVNEPTRSACGAPDYVVAKIKPRLTIGYIEAKDVGADLRAIEKTDQIKRYQSLPNLLVTDYLGFRWYTDGTFRAAASLGEWNGKSIVHASDDGAAALALLADFIQQSPQPIKSARALAVRLAVLAHHVRDIIAEARTRDTSELLRVMQMAFGASLVPEISIPDFADMLAQTIAYGLFAARCADTTPDFTRDEASHLVPRSNPFLQHLFQFIAGRQIDDEPFIGFVDDMVDVLAHADMPSVLADFGTRKKGEDPIVHFYETFLEAYDPAMRAKRGVYYTPAPVASYMVRSIDHILKSVFKLDAGLADGSTASFAKSVTGSKGDLAVQETHPRVLILDPACGTCTFFYVLINFLRDQFMARNLAGQWPDFVKTNLLPRLFGFELLMAPYAVAHLKLGMQLAALDLPEQQRQQWAYSFSKGERLAVYLTNTLEEAVKHSEEFWTRFLAEESNEAAIVKRDKPIMVVLGNPPYSGHSANRSWDDAQGKHTFIGQLLRDYCTTEADGMKKEKNPKWLQDDYVKFIRWGHWRIEQTGSGILAFITNHGYLDNPTFRGMRQQLLSAFNHIYILNLHGNQRKKEKAPDGSRDVNVFDIQQGVAITFFVKEQGNTAPAKVHYADLWGTRETKYQTLDTTALQHTEWTDVAPTAPFHLFIPQNQDLRKSYDKGWKVTDIFPVNCVGLVTSRDGFVYDLDIQCLQARIRQFYEKNLTDDEIRRQFKLDNLDVTDARIRFRRRSNWQNCITNCLYRPFDIRPLCLADELVERARTEVMRHMMGPDNLGLIVNRQVRIESIRHAWVTKSPVDLHVIETAHASAYVFPLYLSPEKDASFSTTHRQVNIAPEFLKALAEKLGVLQIKHNCQLDGISPEDIFHYIYAVLCSPTYRNLYAEFLKMDFPLLPLTGNLELFRALVRLGADLAAMHLMTSPALAPCDNPLTSPIQYPATGDDVVEKVRYADSKVYINKAQHFGPVPEAVWQFRIGGYQVAEKWLKDRKGRVLTPADKVHYAKIIVALARTQDLMQQIDKAIPSWPMQ